MGLGEEMISHLPSLPTSPWRGTHHKGRRLLVEHEERWRKPPRKPLFLGREENLSDIKPEIAPPLQDKAEDRTSELAKTEKLRIRGFLPKCRSCWTIVTSSERN
jgi:hypothetical protein